MKILAHNTALSGLCDRFMDVFLLAACADVLNSDLYYVWKENKNFTEHQLRTWNPNRFEDYKLKNFTKYFRFPKLVNFVDENNFNLNGTDFTIFEDYLGGIFSPETFYERYCKQFCKKEDFISSYYRLTSEFRPTEKLLDLIKPTISPDISIHLRRGDKISDNPDIGQIHSTDLERLDLVTKTCIDELITSSTNKPNVFICSDTESIKDEYEKYVLTKNCNIVTYPKYENDIEKTYIDLYLLSQSKTIVMSQKHSNFSMFASQIKKSKLIYFFEKNDMIKNGNFENCSLFFNNIFS